MLKLLAGKTYLASIIIQSCKGIKPETTSYFYCSDKSNDRNTATSILKGLLSQLVRQNRELVPYCLERKNNSASPSLSAFPLAKSLIETICIVLPPVYIVVDGMDECQHPGDRKLLVDTFSSLVKTCDGHSPGKLRVLALSRSFSEVDRTSLPLCIDHFSLAPENSEKDIERYCKVRFHREYGLQKLKLLSEELETAVKIICLRANGIGFCPSTFDDLKVYRHVSIREVGDRKPGKNAEQGKLLLRDGFPKISQRFKRSVIPSRSCITAYLLTDI